MMGKLICVTAVLVLALGLLPGGTVSAADTSGWVLDDHPLITPLGGKVEGKDYDQGYRQTVTPDIITFSVFGVDDRKKNYEVTATFTLDKPPAILMPGQVLTLMAKGMANVTPGYQPYRIPIEMGIGYEVAIEYVEKNVLSKTTILPKDGASGRLTLSLVPPAVTTVSKSNSVSYIVPGPQISSDVLKITIGGDQVSITWVYRAGAGVQKQPALTLKFYDPFKFFKTTTEIGPPSAQIADLVATLQGGAGKEIVFYVDPETPRRDEPGKNLNEVLDITPNDRGDKVKNEPKGRKYLPWTDLTDANGEVRVPLHIWLDRREFASKLLADRYVFGDRGEVSGTVWAGVYNLRTQLLDPLASVTVEYTAMAMITNITGKGRPDDVDPWKKQPGRVRVTRPIESSSLYSTSLNSTAVEAPFPLMPGDIFDVDGNAAVEIVWLTGEKIMGVVPDKEFPSDSPPYQPPYASIILLSSAYDSGFPSGTEQTGERLFGFGAKKGIELVIQSIPYVGKLLKEGVKIAVEVYGNAGVQKEGITGSRVMTRIRVRSKVIIDNTGDNVKVYNIDGSPDIKTVAGGEVTLTNGKMVTVSEEGKLGTPQTFDAKAIESKFQTVPAGASPATSPDKLTAPSLSRRAPPAPAKVGISVTSYVIRAAALTAAIIVVLALRLRMKKKKS